MEDRTAAEGLVGRIATVDITGSRPLLLSGILKNP
jgi:hypothetical protein